MTRAREQAREAYAAEFDRLGGALSNTANSLRGGFENFWVKPAIDALERLIVRVPVDEEDGDE